MKKIEGSVFVDDRGSLRFVNDFNFENVKRFYQVENHEQGYVRAWHGHKKEGKYVYVPRGSVWVGVIDMDTEEVEKHVLSSDKPQILFIPPNKYNGFQTLTDDAIIMFFSTVTMEEAKGDDFRLPYDKFQIFNKEYR